VPATEAKEGNTPAQTSTPAKSTNDAPTPADGQEKQKENVAKDDGAKELEKKEDKNDDENEDESESEAEPEPDNDDDDTPANPWNAVAVIGLRLYARDPDVTITLQSAKAEEATTLTLEGQPAGATI
jgi:hypothetical protein